ncbi:unnamed protein product [Coccothraustes coccothraustes]
MQRLITTGLLGNSEGRSPGTVLLSSQSRFWHTLQLQLFSIWPGEKQQRLCPTSLCHVLLSHQGQLRLPRPNLSVLPGHEVAVGAEVMFRCTTTQPSTGCYLYLEGQIQAQMFLREQGDSLSLVQKGDSGRYSCQCYTLSAFREWSAVSNTLDLVVRGKILGKLCLLLSVKRAAATMNSFVEVEQVNH